MKRKYRKPFKTPQRRVMEFLRIQCKETESGCLEFQGNVWSRSGHVHAYFGGKRYIASRYVFATLVSHPGELHVLHTCDNPRCMNIDHLWLGTQLDNSLDMTRKGRTVAQQRTHCTRGHPYDDSNTVRWGKDQWRNCKICRRGRNRVKAGWPEDLAYSMAPVPMGRRPVGGKFKRGRRAECEIR